MAPLPRAVKPCRVTLPQLASAGSRALNPCPSARCGLTARKVFPMSTTGNFDVNRALAARNRTGPERISVILGPHTGARDEAPHVALTDARGRRLRDGRRR